MARKFCSSRAWRDFSLARLMVVVMGNTSLQLLKTPAADGGRYKVKGGERFTTFVFGALDVLRHYKVAATDQSKRDSSTAQADVPQERNGRKNRPAPLGMTGWRC